jgi:hypothetical protein
MPELPFHRIRVIHAQRVAVSKENDGDRQPYRRFRGSDNHNEKDKDLAVHLVQMPGECDEGQIDRIQHQLEAQKNGNDILLDDKADRANDKKQQTQNKIVQQSHNFSGTSF